MDFLSSFFKLYFLPALTDHSLFQFMQSSFSVVVHPFHKEWWYESFRGFLEDCEHEDLLKTLVKHPGKVLLSGYENEMYTEYLSGWKKAHKKTRAECGATRVETLWMNYDADQGQLSLPGL